MKAKGVLEKKKDIKEEEKANEKQKQKQEQASRSNLTRTIILGLVGLVLVLLPDTLNKIIGIVVGVALLIVGLVNIYRYMKGEDNSLTLITGILYSVLGVIIMVYPHSVIRLVAICLGVYLLISSLIKLKTALYLKTVTTKWVGTLVIALLIMVLGLLLIFNPFSGIAITKLAGAFLVVVAIFDLIDVYVIQKGAKNNE